MKKVGVKSEDMVGIGADNPIRTLEEDTVGRAKSAYEFAEHILQIDASEGLVVGVLGPWGSGKTSFVNLTRLCLQEKGIAVLDFNPWMFSGTTQLLDSFFAEISSQLKLRPGLAAVGRGLDDYAEIFSGMAWVPVVGPWVERGRIAAKAIAKVFQRNKESLSGRRAKVEKALGALEEPFVVVLDDIDRLTTSEIQDIFKLVRLTANFPNIIYLMAFDRDRVENALGEHKIPGRAYLEKILQFGMDIPVVPNGILNGQIFIKIDEVLSRIKNKGDLDSERWPDIFYDVIRPLIENMRDVRRYVAAVYCSVNSLNSQISLVDVLALESIRVFTPDIFRQLQHSVASLTTVSDYHVMSESEHLKKQIDVLVGDPNGKYANIVKSLIKLVFPAGGRHVGGSSYGRESEKEWLRERRVAHQHVLRLYLERTAGDELNAFVDAEIAWSRMTSASDFDDYLRSLEASRLYDIIAALEVFETKFCKESVVPGTVVLLNIMQIMPERQRGMFELDSRTVVRRVVFRLLRSLDSADAVEEAVSCVLPQLTTLSARQELLSIAGHEEGSGHKLISVEAARQFEKDWRAEVAAASVESLANEKTLLRLLLHAKMNSCPTDPPVIIDSSPQITFALLRSARSESLSQSGGRAVKRQPLIAWDALVTLYGDEAILKERVEVLKSLTPEADDPLVELACRYAGGWRPKSFGED